MTKPFRMTTPFVVLELTEDECERLLVDLLTNPRCQGDGACRFCTDPMLASDTYVCIEHRLAAALGITPAVVGSLRARPVGALVRAARSRAAASTPAAADPPPPSDG